MSTDVIVEEVRRVRHELVEKHGGLDGWIQHLQQMDRERRGKRRTRSMDERGSRIGRQRPRRVS